MTSDAEPPLTLYLIRHGQTEWSLSGQHTGRTDIALTAEGEAEARQLAPWLGGLAFAHVFCSPRQRAVRTCALAGVSRTPAIDADLAEWDYGEYEGLRSAEIRQARPDWNVFIDGCPGGETPGAVAARADRLIGRLAGLRGNVALFSHGHFGPALATRWIGLEIAAARHLPLGTAAVNILGSAPKQPDVRVISLWNATPALLTAFGGG